MKKLIRCIQELCDIQGVSGSEDNVRDYIIDEIKEHATSYHVDALGNLIAFKKGKNTSEKTIMFSAHMDEVGFIITFIDENGLLRFASVGGIDPRVVIGKAVMIGKIYGVIGSKAVHLQTDEERGKAPKLDTLFIDIGASTKEEAETMVSLGDRAVFYSKFSVLGKDLICAKALDDRAGCALLIELIKTNLEKDCYFAFTVQEENGCIGAGTAAYAVKPDIGIIVETTTASDIPDVDAHKVVCSLGDGPVISFMDKGTIYDKSLFNQALKIAGERKIHCQLKAGVYGGNESRSVQCSRSGTKVLAVSMPCRYLHSPSCVLRRSDITETFQLLKALSREL